MKEKGFHQIDHYTTEYYDEYYDEYQDVSYITRAYDPSIDGCGVQSMPSGNGSLTLLLCLFPERWLAKGEKNAVQTHLGDNYA